MRLSARRDRIVELLMQHQRMTVEELAQQLAASQETIRRDLTELAARNRLRKFHGGATLPDSIGEGAFRSRMVENLDAKRAIARRAAALFAPGDSLFVDTGSTTIAFASELAQASDVTVITNSVGIAQAVSRSGANPTYLLGGEHRHEAGENVGSLVLQQLAGFSPRHAVLTVGGLGPKGIADFDLAEAEIARTMIARAAEVTVLADASKLGREALFFLCGLERIARLVTDRPPPPPLAEALAQAGVAVLLPSDRKSAKID
ncbi:DeoR/GlpR family DNA-binding transcription regulator [Roseomonas sp. USHLN139]|uniref:DeoR/GlpR family DNA-binding transcription regulator n=1 Tax=Roseomonas sp. USHLN139 TaxID=3081298 RepID=UPI003B01FB40